MASSPCVIAVLGLCFLNVCFAFDCPRQFDSVIVGGKNKCIEIYLDKQNSYNKFLCGERLGVENLSDVDTSSWKFKRGSKMWVDSIRVYEGGPFVDWKIGGSKIGEPILAPELWKSNSSNDFGDCLAYDVSTREYSVERCNDGQSIVCLSEPYTQFLERGECKEDFYYLTSPAPTCVTTMALCVSKKRDELNNVCKKIGGSLVTAGWIHTKHSFLTDKQKKGYIPTNAMKDKNGKIYCDDPACYTVFYYTSVSPQTNVTKFIMIDDEGMYSLENSNQQTYDHFYCEHKIAINDKILISSVNNNLIVTMENKTDVNDVTCFTDSVKYYPTQVKTYIDSTNELTLKVETRFNGIYWCVSKSTKHMVEDSKRVLWIGDENLARNTEVLFLKLPIYSWDRDDEFNAKKNDFKPIQYKMEKYWENNIRKVLTTLNNLITEPSYKYKVYTDGTLLLLLYIDEGILKDERNPRPDQNFDFVYHKDQEKCRSDFGWKYEIKRKHIDENYYTLSKTMIRNCKSPIVSTELNQNSKASSIDVHVVRLMIIFNSIVFISYLYS